MKKDKSDKRKLLIMFSLILGIVFIFFAVISAALFSSDNEVKIFDSEKNLIATIKQNGDIDTTSYCGDEVIEYINIVIDEVSTYYSESKAIKYNSAKKLFLGNAQEVYTNLDIGMLSKIQQAYLDSDVASQSNFASVITDTNGRILASFGKGSSENIVYSLYKTYAGSTIKPISVYTPNIESARACWSSKIKDAPIKEITDASGRTRWWPSNASGKYTYEDMLLCDALKKSTNTVAVRLLKDYSVKKAISFMESNFDIDLNYEKSLVQQYGDEEVLSNLALGYLYAGVSPLDMAGYYQIFANSGTYTKPYAVISVEGNKGTSYKTEIKTKRVISQETAQVMNELLKGVVLGDGTGKDAFIKGVEVAGKSGTSDNYADNWFVGCTPDYVCSVWHSNNGMHHNYASSLFADIVSGLPMEKSKFPSSHKITTALYCKTTGLLKGPYCKNISLGHYLSSNVPKICNCSI